LKKLGHSAILILVNHDVVIYNFRLELVERLLADGYEVHISSPYGERIDELIALGAVYHEITIDRHGMNPVKDFFILMEYKKLCFSIRPIAVLGYTIKPNIYGAMVAKWVGVPFIANITGLGTAVENDTWKQKITVLLYKIAFTKVQRVFFQNKENREFFRRNRIALDKYKLLPGSGVNLDRYPVSPLPECGDGKTGSPVKFAFISRIMKEKGIEQYLSAAELVKKKYPATEFHVCGYCETEYHGRLEEMNKTGIVKYHGMIHDVSNFISSIHCVVHPTYYPEGLSNILLESCSSGRAIITTERSGCREVIIDKVNGYMVPEKNVKELVLAIERYIKLSKKEKTAMGLEGRKFVERNFNRQIVVDNYMEEIYIAEKACKMCSRKAMSRKYVKLKNS
jgi:glycosyltransferase involved in cell wall biosynthesis